MVVGAVALAGCATGAGSAAADPGGVEGDGSGGLVDPTVGLYMAGLSGGGVAYASDQTTTRILHRSGA